MLLMQELLPVICSIAGDVVAFQQDNASIHRADDTVELLCRDRDTPIGNLLYSFMGRVPETKIDWLTDMCIAKINDVNPVDYHIL